MPDVREGGVDRLVVTLRSGTITQAFETEEDLRAILERIAPLVARLNPTWEVNPGWRT